MSVNGDDLNDIDFTSMADKGQENIPLTTSGNILLHEFLEPLGLSANALATDLHVPANRITAIIKGQRGIAGDTALRLSRYFSKTPEFWMNLQASYDLKNC